MAIFNTSIPSNDEAVKLGASRIRDMKVSLNSMLSQIFDDSFVFLPKWIDGSLIENDASNDTLRAISSDHIKTGAAILRTFPDGVFTADSGGRAKFADGFVTSNLLDPSLTLPDNIISEANLQDGIVSTAKLGALAATIAKVGSGVAKIAIGSYTGSNSLSATVSGLPFAPSFVLLSGGPAFNILGVSFLSEASANIGPIHRASDAGSIASPNVTAMNWTSDGFIVVPSAYAFNTSGISHAYVALKV